MSNSLLNRKAVKTYALELSKNTRAGKFTRVSEQFIEAVEAQVSARLRAIGPAASGSQPIGETLNFVNGKGRKIAAAYLQEYTKSVIASKVQSHPSIGVTLK